MNRIPFAGKMLIIGTIFTVPIALLVVVLFLQIKGDIDFAAQERLGTRYTKALRPLFGDLQAYRLARDSAERATIRARVDGDFRVVGVEDAGPCAALGLTTALDALEKKWRSGSSIDTVLDDTLTLLVAVSDNSKITLDPILDGYYVGDTMVNKLPRVIDAVSHAEVIGTRILANGRMGQDERIAITIISGDLSTNAEGTTRNLAIALEAAPYLRPHLDASIARERKRSAAFSAVLQSTILTGTRRSSMRANYARTARAAYRASLELYDGTIDGLDDVLRVRIAKLVDREVLIFSIVLATIVGATLTMLYTTRSIARRLGNVTSAIRTIVSEDMTRLVEIASAVAKGDKSDKALVERSPLVDDGRDEAAVLAQSYNSLVQRLAQVNADFVTMTKLLSTRAFHDALTGLANRALFMERITQMIARNQRHHDRFAAVLFLDLDRFKLVNDSLGHLAGDQLLIAVARRLEGCLRVGDTLARLGGDEFTFLLEDIHLESDATTFAERVLAELTRPFLIENREMYASASIGIAVTRIGYDTSEALLRDADIAMYRSKQAGKNRATLFAPEFLEHASQALALDIDLTAAIERREFVLFYQPIVALDDNVLRGFEALVRWRHPRRGLLGPAEFIAAAEESGAIFAIGAQVIEEACRQAAQWRATFDLALPLEMSINVSARQLSSPRLIAQISDAVATFGLSPGELHVEITESAIMENPKIAAETLAQLHGRGISVHLDDFGTGYSSLGYLHQFPVDTIKIDRSFISMSGRGLGNPQIVTTIASLARSLSMKTTVEGIETAEQLAHLREIGCTNGQGYYFSKPVDAVAATALIASWRPTAIRAVAGISAALS